MIDDEFPALWPGFLEEIMGYLVSTDYQQLMGALLAFYEIAKKFQYAHGHTRHMLTPAGSRIWRSAWRTMRCWRPSCPACTSS